MNTSHSNAGERVKDVNCTEDELIVSLQDGRTISVPLVWYPRLLAASPEQRNRVELMPMGIHWPEVDEDISIASILRGEKAQGASQPPQ